jgi:hypothetical protein
MDNMHQDPVYPRNPHYQQDGMQSGCLSDAGGQDIAEFNQEDDPIYEDRYAYIYPNPTSPTGRYIGYPASAALIDPTPLGGDDRDDAPFIDLNEPPTGLFPFSFVMILHPKKKFSIIM